jgi:hypothetical protein
MIKTTSVMRTASMVPCHGKGKGEHAYKIASLIDITLTHDHFLVAKARANPVAGG